MKGREITSTNPMSSLFLLRNSGCLEEQGRTESKRSRGCFEGRTVEMRWCLCFALGREMEVGVS
jgi:hypothetical protein